MNIDLINLQNINNTNIMNGPKINSSLSSGFLDILNNLLKNNINGENIRAPIDGIVFFSNPLLRTALQDVEQPTLTTELNLVLEELTDEISPEIENIKDLKLDEDDKPNIKHVFKDEDDDMKASDLESMFIIPQDSFFDSNNYNKPDNGAGEDKHKPTQEIVSNLLNKMDGSITVEKILINSPAAGENVGFENTKQYDVINQITSYIKNNYSQVEVGTRIEIQLNPASLGKINIEVIHEDNNIFIKFDASNYEVGHLLQSQIHELENFFKETSFKEVEINILVNEKSNYKKEEEKKDDKKRKYQEKYKRFKTQGGIL